MNLTITKRIPALLSIPIIILASFVFVLYPVQFIIESPRLGQPQIILAGEPLHINIKSSIPYWNHHWSASLQNINHEFPLNITSIINNFSRHRLNIKTSKSLPPGKYNLIIHDADKFQIASAAVNIWQSYPDKISIIQLADLPTFSKYGNQQGDIQFEQIIEEINIINPDLVLFTGDLVYGGKQQQYERFFTSLKKINVPIIAAPGNHEYQGWSSFLSYFGKPYHENNIGEYKIVSINSGHARDQLTESQLHWLNSVFKNSTKGTTILQSHHSIMHKPKQRGYLKYHASELKQLVKDYSVPIVLSGHWHADSVWNEASQEQFETANFKGTPYAVTTSAGAVLRKKHSSAEPMYHGYRLIRIQHNKLVNFTYDIDGAGIRHPSKSIPMGLLNRVDSSPLNTTIVNKLNESFDSARIDMIILGKNKQLHTNYGKVDNIEFDGINTTYSIIFALPKNTTVHINLQQPSTRASNKI